MFVSVGKIMSGCFGIISTVGHAGKMCGFCKSRISYRNEEKSVVQNPVGTERFKKSDSDFSPDVVLSLQNLVVNIKDVPQIVYMHQSLPFQDIKKFSF